MSIQHLRRLCCALLIGGAVLLAGCNGTSAPPAATPGGSEPGGATAPAGTPQPTTKPGDAGEGQPIPYPAYRPPENNARPTP